MAKAKKKKGAKSTESKISNTEWGMAIGVLLCVDIAEIGLDVVFGVGLVTDPLIDFVINLAWPNYLYLRGVNLKSAKMVGTLVVGGGLQLIPGFDGFWAIEGAIVFLIVKAEEKIKEETGIDVEKVASAGSGKGEGGESEEGGAPDEAGEEEGEKEENEGESDEEDSGEEGEGENEEENNEGDEEETLDEAGPYGNEESSAASDERGQKPETARTAAQEQDEEDGGSSEMTSKTKKTGLVNKRPNRLDLRRKEEKEAVQAHSNIIDLSSLREKPDEEEREAA